MKKIGIIIGIIILVIFAYLVLSGENKTTETIEFDSAAIGLPEGKDLATLLNEKMSGTWQSVDDEKSILVLQKDGVVEDVYDGESMSTGAWSTTIVATEAGEKKLQLEQRITDESYLYDVMELSDDFLVLSYTNGLLQYARVAE